MFIALNIEIIYPNRQVIILCERFIENFVKYYWFMNNNFVIPEFKPKLFYNKCNTLNKHQFGKCTSV